MVRGYDNSRFVVGVVRGEILYSFQDLGRLVGREDVISSPYLVVLVVCLQSVVGDDAEAVTTSFQDLEEVCDRR